MGDDDHEANKMVVVGEKYCYKEEKELTVHKKSMFSHGDGFTVYDPNGDVIFRVDFYGVVKEHHGLVLMDTFGKPLLTLLPKRLSLHQRWEGFLGEKSDDQKPIFSIWKSTIIGRSRVIMVKVYQRSSLVNPTDYQIKGSFGERDCTIFRMSRDTSLDHVAQIKRKVEPTRKIVLSRDVFSLNLKPGFDAAFAVGLVLALDRIDGDKAAPPTTAASFFLCD